MSILNVCDRVSNSDFSDLLKGSPCPPPFLDQQQLEGFAREQFGHQNLARCVIDLLMERCVFIKSEIDTSIDDLSIATLQIVAIVLGIFFAVILGVIAVVIFWIYHKKKGPKVHPTDEQKAEKYMKNQDSVIKLPTETQITKS